MRIAYCFSGYLRRFWDNPTLLEHIINRAPGDLFVHTWATLNYAGPTWHGDSGLSTFPVDDCVIEKLQRQYGKPLQLEVEHPPQFPEHLMPVAQARYSSMKANDMKSIQERKAGAKYDVTLNLRFDLTLHEPFSFPDLIESDVLYCLANQNCVSQKLCCDILNFGSSQTMDKINSIFNGLMAGKVTETSGSYGERLLTKWCEFNRIPFRYIAVRSSILRSDGSLLEIPVS